ncbi:MAG: glycosyltransferase family 4 protein [Deltaproteobacteria bacterium]
MPISEVEIFVNGRSRGLARIGIQREDIERLGRTRHALLSGFELIVDVDGPASAATVSDRAVVLVVARQLHGPTFVIAERSHPLHGVAGDCPDGPRTGEVFPAAAPRSSPAPRRPALKGGDLSLLVVTHDLNLGGAQLWLLELLRRGGAGREFPCTVRTDTDGPLRPTLEALQIAVEVGGRAPLKRWTDYETEVARLADRVVDGRFSALLANTFGTFIGPDAASRVGIPSVWAIHESWSPPMFWLAAYGPGGIDPVIQKAALGALASCPAVVFEAQATRSLYLPWTKPESSVVVPYGVDVSAADEFCASVDRHTLREELGLPPEARVLLMMGTIERRKGQTLLAQAFGEVAQRYEDAYLVFVGDTHSPYSKALRRCLASMHLGDRVRVLPVTPDIATWYRASDVLVCASDIESMPRSVLDAMSYGAVILATSVFGLPEVITDAETGFLFEANSLRAAIVGLERVLSLDETTVRRVGAAGQAVVRRNHHADGYGRSIRGLLEDLVSRPGTSAAVSLAQDLPVRPT